jgi:predicted ATPase/DNA-binding CsgD family transcriptional regulator
MAASPSTLLLGSLPIPRTRLIGRETERATARGLLLDEAVPVLTLTGPGGVGKTRLALTIAGDSIDHFDERAVFVDLARLSDPNLVVPAVALTLGIAEGRDRPVSERLVGALQRHHLLLVFDNCEHLLAAVADLVSQLLATCPKLQILATSRAPLRIRGEQELPIDPLPVPPLESRHEPELVDNAAVQLFLDRARAVAPQFSIANDALHQVAKICRDLDGLPLAIELAAARVRVLTPLALHDRLQHRLPLLEGGARDTPARQRTMHTTIAWSYDLLSPEDQGVFRRLAVFSGGFTLEAAQAVASCEPTTEVLPQLERLVEHNLVRRDEQATPSRCQILETIREYGLEQLAASGEEETTQNRHAAYYLALAQRVEADPPGPAGIRWLGLLETEHPNLRAALAWLFARGEAEACLRLASAVWQFWYAHGHLHEGRQWLEQTLARADQAPADLRAKALVKAGALAHYQGDDAQAVLLLEAGLALSRELGNSWVTPDALLMRGIMAEDQGRYVEAARLLEEAYTVAAQMDYHTCMATTLGHLAVVAYGEGDLPRAVTVGEEALQLARAFGDTFAAGIALHYLGLTACAQGDHARAARCLSELHTVDVLEGNREANNFASFAVLAAGIGQMESAARLFGAGEALREAVGAALALPERATYEHVIATARATLGDDAFAAAWAVGRVLSLDETTTLTREVADAALRLQPSARPRDAGAHHRLTSRESEVLRLLAEGNSDRQIADTLSISPKTAGNHVSSILAKLGVTTRTAAAAHAIRLGLA